MIERGEIWVIVDKRLEEIDLGRIEDVTFEGAGGDPVPTRTSPSPT